MIWCDAIYSASAIAQAMEQMPDNIADYRESTRLERKKKKEKREQEKEKEKVYIAASKKLMDMRALVADYERKDDVWFDADDNYYRNAYGTECVCFRICNNHVWCMIEKVSEIDRKCETLPTSTHVYIYTVRMYPCCIQTGDDGSTSTNNDDESGESSTKRTNSKSRQRARARVKMQKAFKERALMADETEKDLQTQKEMEEDVDVFKRGWDDGKPWDVRRSMDEQAYLAQLANEPEILEPRKPR